MEIRDTDPATALARAASALQRVLREDRYTPLSHTSFVEEGDEFVYVPPATTASQLFVAPEVARLTSPPGPQSERFGAAMCLRAFMEGHESIERQLVRSLRVAEVDEVWRRWRTQVPLQFPDPPKRAYPGLGRARLILMQMTRPRLEDRGGYSLADVRNAALAESSANPARPRTLRSVILLVVLALAVAVGVFAVRALLGGGFFILRQPNTEHHALAYRNCAPETGNNMCVKHPATAPWAREETFGRWA